MRRRDIPTNPENPNRKVVADFFGMEIKDVSVQPQENTFVINIKENANAQEQFKTICAFGNGKNPGIYNFKDDIIVWWNGSKIQPV